MLIAFVSEPSDGNGPLADGLRAAGHIVRFVTPESDGLAMPEEKPDAVIANGPEPSPITERLASVARSGCVIALLSQDSLSLLRPGGLWTDFVVEPYRAAEVAARIALHHTRSQKEPSEVIHRGPLSIDVTNYTVFVHNDQIEMTYKEYELLKFLATHPGRVFTRESLLEQVWGYDYFGGSRTIDVHIRRIRAKLPIAVAAMIETVHQVGYRFSAQKW